MTPTEAWEYARKGPWNGRYDKKTDTEWKWDVKDDILYLAFQGSGSLLDWLMNFAFWPVLAVFKRAYSKGEIHWYAHWGFLRKWKAVREDVLQIIRENDIKKVVSSSFSQGAGVNVLAHEGIRYHHPDLELETHLWGCPRAVFKKNFDKIVDRFKGCIRYVVRRDVVTKVPFSWMGFRHIGGSILRGLAGFSLKFKKNHMSYGEYEWKSV